MLNRTSIKMAVYLCLTLSASSVFAANDGAGCKDNPIVSRFQGATLLACQHKRFDETSLPLGKWEFNHPAPSKSTQVSGQISSYFYTAPTKRGSLEIVRNYETALTKAGFSIPFLCGGNDQCGMALAPNELQQLQTFADRFGEARVAGMAAINGSFHALTAHLERPQGTIDLFLIAVDQNEPEGLKKPVVYMKVVEGKPMNMGEVTVDAKAISKGLAQNGHIALYGIHFATDSATIESSSAQALREMAKMLEQESAARVYIVGHTDDKGALDHNLKLSHDRAEAVVKALVAQYGISPNRLVAEGVASFAPVASNASEQGRALNRRVEMVLQ